MLFRSAYVDFAITAPWGALLLEVDEDQHSHQHTSCDPRRDFDMCASLALGSGHKVVELRYNPDSFRIDGTNVTVAAKERQRRLVEVVRAWLLDDPAPDRQLARALGLPAASRGQGVGQRGGARRERGRSHIRHPVSLVRSARKNRKPMSLK